MNSSKFVPKEDVLAPTNNLLDGQFVDRFNILVDTFGFAVTPGVSGITASEEAAA